MADETVAIRSIYHAIATRQPNVSTSRYAQLIKQSKATPRTSDTRLRQSLSDRPGRLADLKYDGDGEPGTYLYLAYGSNLCALTFLERRQIRPLSQVNVVVPAIRLTFDLPGVPYTEPCFGNCEYREDEPNQDSSQEKGDTTRLTTTPMGPTDYHKNHWHKGMVGVVYEVTASDYAHIIATEGGGSAYTDVLVDCHVLPPDPSLPVPVTPTGTPLKAHTLFSPARSAVRPDHSYAQPSPRYLKLLTDGAAEHDLPHEYRSYLSQIRTYHTTTTKQELGRFVFQSVWGPILAFLFMGAGHLFLRPDGTYPRWWTRFAAAVFTGMWRSYAAWFAPTFGDGERTIGDETDDGPGPREPGDDAADKVCSEKTPLLGGMVGWGEPGTRGGEEMV